jgi:hypothetical protein
VIPDEAVEAAAASEEVRRAFANREASIRALIARAAEVSPDVARELGY